VTCEDTRARYVLPRLDLDEEMIRGTDLERCRAVDEQLRDRQISGPVAGSAGSPAWTTSGPLPKASVR